MKFDIITIFPQIFDGVFDHGITRRAMASGVVDIKIRNLRDFATDKHKSVDDRPYGGGEGMVLMPDPLFHAVEHCQDEAPVSRSQVVLLSPQGRTWSQGMAAELATNPHTILICGRYEGVDQRVVDALVDREISIGDFILSGGEIPAMVLVDSVIRLLPGVVGNEDSIVNESFSTGLLDYPQYTRPAEYRGMQVPEVLLSGDHARIERWRKERAIEKTQQNRPEMIKE
jgi:tRNA (guanine37-N1)-methyltransferase